MKFQNRFRAALSAVLVLVFSAGPAFADVVQGKIASMNTTGVNLTIYDDQGRAYPNLLPVRVSDPLILKNLRTYDWVSAEVVQSKTGFWQAESIKRIPTPQTSASGAAFSGAPRQPSALGDVSNNLKNALSSPQAKSALRSGLAGAVTGAIASTASGGKMGKGALVGAGVGAVASLLQGIFNAPAPQAITEPAPYFVEERPQHPSGQRIVRFYDKDGHLVSEEIR